MGLQPRVNLGAQSLEAPSTQNLVPQQSFSVYALGWQESSSQSTFGAPQLLCISESYFLGISFLSYHVPCCFSGQCPNQSS